MRATPLRRDEVAAPSEELKAIFPCPRQELYSSLTTTEAYEPDSSA
jgi:hypothetical protein